MPEPDEQRRAVTITEAVTEMLRGLFAGERVVDSASDAALSTTAVPAAYRQRYVVRNMRAELNFEATLDRTFRFLRKRTSQKPAAQVKVIMSLEPTLNPVATMPSARPPLIAVPDFMHAPGETRPLPPLNIDSLASRVTPAEGTMQGPLFLNRPADWLMLDDIVKLLETVAQWRSGRMVAHKVPLSRATGDAAPAPDTDTYFAWLLSSILDGCAQVAGVLESESGTAQQAEGVRISELMATVRVYRENQGELAPNTRPRHHPAAVQRLDVLVSPAAVTDDGVTLLTFDLPDFLVEGELHRRFLVALRAARDKVDSALRENNASFERKRLDADQVSSLLEATKQPGHGLVIRVDNDDTDLVLLHDETAQTGLILEVEFRLSRDDSGTDPSVDGVRKIRVVAHRRDGGWKGSLYDSATGELRAPYYFVRLLRTLHALQECVTTGLASAGEAVR